VSPLARNYVDTIVAQLEPLLDDCDIDLLRLFALLVLVKDEDTTEEDVHDAWSVWRTASNPKHSCLVPFDDLTPDVQAVYTRYAEAVRAVARAMAQPAVSRG
jgi:hypothetical protein